MPLYKLSTGDHADRILWDILYESTGFFIVANWENNSVQFPRLIAELEAAGAFTSDVIKNLCESMDLDADDICELIDRAQREWEYICKRL